MKKQRKHYTPEEKVAILRQLLDKEPISKLCDEPGLQPTVFLRRRLLAGRHQEAA